MRTERGASRSTAESSLLEDFECETDVDAVFAEFTESSPEEIIELDDGIDQPELEASLFDGFVSEEELRTPRPDRPPKKRVATHPTEEHDRFDTEEIDEISMAALFESR